MKSSLHRIRRLQWRVSTRAMDQALLLRQRLCNQWQDELLPAIATVFDEMNWGDDTLHIPKLELHLSVNSLEDLNDRLPDLIRQQLKAQLKPLKSQSQERDRHSQSLQQSALTVLLHYLRTGSVPWQVTHQTSAELTHELQETCQQQRSRLLSQLLPAVSVACYFRLLQLIPSTQWNEFVMEVGDRLPSTIRSTIVQILISLSNKSIYLTRYSQLNLASVLLSESLKLPTTGSLEQLLEAIASNLTIPEQRVLEQIIAALSEDAIASSIPALSQHLHLPHLIPSEVASIALNEPSGESNPVASTAASPDFHPPSSELLPSNLLLSDLLLSQGNELGRDSQPAIAPEDFPLAIRDAGLLLTAPFLTRLLETTEIKDPQYSKIPDAQLPRAAALLHYLVTGDDTLFEHELTLIKVLLGLTPDQSLLVAEGLLQPNDKAEAEALLESLINYWGALKTISVDGLRSSFLQRSGLLRDRDNAWWVQVEPKPYDMLLNQLPWSISVVKLPWMQRPIYSEWQTP